MRKILTVILAHVDVEKQQAHLQKGALFLPEPEPPPEPFAELVLRVEVFTGRGIDLDARVLQILEGRGIAVTFDDLAAAKAKLAPVFASSEPGEDEATFVFWGRGEKRKTSLPPRRKTSAPPSRRSVKPPRKSVKPSAKKSSKRPLAIDPAFELPKTDPPPSNGPPADPPEMWGDTLPKIPIAKPANVRPPLRKVVVVPRKK